MIPIGDSTRLKKPSVITPLIIWINVLVYLYVIFSGSTLGKFAYLYGLIPTRVMKAIFLLPEVSPVLWTLITSLFLHGGIIHLVGNMLFLRVFGDNIEDRMGKFSFLLFYLLGGIVASFAQLISNPSSIVPMIGASGAISAVLGAYIYLYPGESVEALFFFFILPISIRIPVFIFLLFWFGSQLFNAFSGVPGVGWLAHIGGFLFGVLFARLLLSRQVKPGAREVIYPK